MTPKNCPSCGKGLEKIQDYPRVEIKSVELLELPEKILHYSSQRSVRMKEYMEKNNISHHTFRDEPEIDLTEEIKTSVNSESVQQYLGHLQSFTGLIETNQLNPPFEKNSFNTYKIPNSKYSLSIVNLEDQEDIATLEIWGPGPNYGSAGGPTLHGYGQIAKIEFKGKLLSAGNS